VIGMATEERALILIVDDEPRLLQLTERLLAQAGYRAITTTTGEDALRLARKHGPSVILLDVVLKGESGTDICRKIKSDPDLSSSLVVLLSASSTASEAQAKGLEAGADGYIARPISNRELVARVQAMVRLHDAEQALRASQQFLQSALDALSSNIAVLDEQGTIVAVNASWRRFGMLNGLQWADGGIGRNYLGVVDAAAAASSEGARAAAQGLRQVMAGERASYWQEYPCHSPHEKRWYTMWVTRFESSEGLRIVTSHENVTQRKLAELALRDAKEAAEAARADAEAARQEEREGRLEAERRRQIAESLRGVLTMLNSSRSLPQVLDHIVAQVDQLLDSNAAAIYRTQGPTAPLQIEASQGLKDGHTPQNVPALTGLLRQAIRTRRPVAVRDTWQEDRHPGSPEDTLQPATGPAFADHYRALLAVPIIVRDVPYGGLLLYYEQPHACSQEEVELAAVYGDQVALAIENARLQEQVEESAIAGERSRLARELHDAVTQTLFSASVIAETIPRIWDTHPEEARRGLGELQQLTRGALAEMRTLLLELRPSTLTEKPLGDLLRSLAEATTGRTRVPVDLSVDGEGLLPPQVQVALYRIAQEALNNVVKHAGATAVAVSLRASDGQVTLTVQDNGVGFDPTVAPRAGHFGVSIMRERAQQIGAEFVIASEPSGSTRVTVHWAREQGATHEQV
jgi:signal transduction histidine kinase/CheY-like chemotaxis protein